MIATTLAFVNPEKMNQNIPWHKSAIVPTFVTTVSASDKITKEQAIVEANARCKTQKANCCVILRGDDYMTILEHNLRFVSGNCTLIHTSSHSI